MKRKRQIKPIPKRVLFFDCVIEPVPEVEDSLFAWYEFTVTISLNEHFLEGDYYAYHYTFRLITECWKNDSDDYEVHPTSLVLIEVSAQKNETINSVVCSPRFFPPHYVFMLSDEDITEAIRRHLIQKEIEDEEKSENENNLKERENEVSIFKKWFDDCMRGYCNEDLFSQDALIVDNALLVLFDYLKIVSEKA